MFYLRRIKKNNEIIDCVLGESYVYVNSDTSREEFEKLFLEYHGIKWGDDPEESNEKAYITTSKGIIPIHNNSRYYIMTENGKTFNSL